MDIDIVTQYVLTIAPAVTAVLGCAGAAAVCIARVKKVCRNSEDNIRRERAEAQKGRTASELIKENEDLRRENARLKADNRVFMLKFKGVKVIEDGGDDEGV